MKSGDWKGRKKADTDVPCITINGWSSAGYSFFHPFLSPSADIKVSCNRGLGTVPLGKCKEAETGLTIGTIQWSVDNPTLSEPNKLKVSGQQWFRIKTVHFTLMINDLLWTIIMQLSWWLFFSSSTRTKAPRDIRMIPASTTISVFYVTFLMATAVHSAVIRDNQETTDVTMPSTQELPILDRVCSWYTKSINDLNLLSILFHLYNDFRPSDPSMKCPRNVPSAMHSRGVGASDLDWTWNRCRGTVVHGKCSTQSSHRITSLILTRNLQWRI